MTREDDAQRLADEEGRALEKLGKELEAEFNPDTALEYEIVQRVSSQLWRLRRASLFESATIEAHRAERVQTDPERMDRFRKVFHQVYNPFEKLFEEHPHIKAQLDACQKEQAPEPTQPKSLDEKRNNEPDFSFVGELAFLEALTRLARYEGLLMRELTYTLTELPRNRSKAKSRSNSANNQCGAVSANRILISGENGKQFERLRRDFFKQLKPKTATERELVDHTVALTWRLRRGAAFEAPLISSARAAFKPPATYRPEWAIDGPDHPFLDNPVVGGDPEITPAGRQEAWKQIRAGQKEVEDEIREILGDEAQEILPDLWFMREREIQDKLEKLARYQAALTRQLVAMRKLLRSLQSNATPTETAPLCATSVASSG